MGVLVEERSAQWGSLCKEILLVRVELDEKEEERDGKRSVRLYTMYLAKSTCSAVSTRISGLAASSASSVRGACWAACLPCSRRSEVQPKNRLPAAGLASGFCRCTDSPSYTPPAG